MAVLHENKPDPRGHTLIKEDTKFRPPLFRV